MITIFLSLLFAALSPQTSGLATGVKLTAPSYVTWETAYEHAHAAVAAGLVYDVDPALLLSIAHHESRYDATARTVEPGGKVSCGVMTAVPMAPSSCTTSTVIGGYLAGAAHLREWLDAARGNLQTALVGYAGGYALIARCQRGPVIIRRVVNVCHTPLVFTRRAEWIRTGLRTTT